MARTLTLTRRDENGRVLVRRSAGFVRVAEGGGVHLSRSLGAVRITEEKVFVTVPFGAPVYGDVDASARTTAKSPSRGEVFMDVDARAHHAPKTRRENRSVQPVRTSKRAEKSVRTESSASPAVGSLSSVETRRAGD